MHNVLADLEEPVAKKKKVTDFLNGISDPSLALGKTVVNGDAHKLSNFEACQQYFCALVEAPKTSMGDGAHEGRHKISLMKCNRNKNTQQKQKKPCIHAGHNEMKEWNDLMDNEKAQVQKLCKEKKAECKVVEISKGDGLSAVVTIPPLNHLPQPICMRTPSLVHL